MKGGARARKPIHPVVEARAGESWSPVLEVSLELVLREFRLEITADEGPLGRSAIRYRAAVGEVSLPFIFARPSPPAARSWLSNSWLIVAIHSIRNLRATDTRSRREVADSTPQLDYFW